MQKRTIFSGVLLLLIFLPTIVLAQMHFKSATRALCANSGGMTAEPLDLDAGQKEAVEKIDRFYNDLMSGVQGDLMRKRFELQSVFRNPQADEEKIRAMAREISQLQDQCLATMIEHQIKIRALLRPEQLRRWCTLVDSCVTKGPVRER
jgi:Spy/CpxP family protein refolding chaperone